MSNWKNIFKKKAIIGMIHVKALPGTPKNKLSVDKIIDLACQEVEIYQNNGIDAIIIENMHDVPYLNRNVGPEIVASMTAIARTIKSKTNLPCGIQILAGANKEAIAVAQSANFDFIRAEGFIFSHVADEGIMNADSAELLRFRKNIGADSIDIFTDIKKKHSSHAITSDLSIGEIANAAQFFLSDGLIVTGSSTGKPAQVSDLNQVSNSSNLPILIGSGINDENISEFWNHADGFIVGSYFKDNGYWENDISVKRIQKLMSRVKQLRNGNE